MYLIEFDELPSHLDADEILEATSEALTDSLSRFEVEYWEAALPYLEVEFDTDGLVLDIGDATPLAAAAAFHWFEWCVRSHPDVIAVLSEGGGEINTDPGHDDDPLLLFQVDGALFGASTEHGWVLSDDPEPLREVDLPERVRQRWAETVKRRACDCSICRAGRS